MAYADIQEMCLRLNQLISEALFKHQIGDQNALQARDNALAQAKCILTQFLDGLPKTANVQVLVDLEAELAKLLAKVNIYADEIPMELIFQINKVVSEALANHFKTENMELLILLNKEISSALIDRSQIVRREKLQTIMGILSSKTKDSAARNETTRALYRLKGVLLDTLAENSQDEKHDLLLKLNILLGAFMATGHSDKNTEWLVKLNYYAALIMVKKFKDPTQLLLMNQHLAHAIRKTSPVEAIFKDLTQLNFHLSSIMIATDVPLKLGRMIEWKLIYSDVMYEALEGDCLRYMDEQGTTVYKQVTAAEISCLKAQLVDVRKERDFLKEEQKKLSPSSATVGLDTTVPGDVVEPPKSAVKKPVFDEVTHLRLVLSRNDDEEEVDEVVPRKKEGIAAGGGPSTSREKTVVSGKGTETVEEKKDAEEAGQQNAEIPAARQTKWVRIEEENTDEGGEEKGASEEKKVKTLFYTMPQRARKDYKKPDPRAKGPENEK